jgi:predicted phosphate transport protein (TIGR00153 family)
MAGKTTDAFFFESFVNHAKCTLEAVRLVRTMLDEPARATELAQKVVDLERRGDRLTYDVIKQLHETWITPFDRADIHTLIARLDDVLDQAEGAAERFALFELTTAMPEAIALADLLVKACEHMLRGAELLSSMKRSEELLALSGEIAKCEGDADVHYRKGLAYIYKTGSDPLIAMKWRDVIDSLENATDRCEDVANVFEGIVLEYS